MIPSFLLVSCNLSLCVCSLLCCRVQRVGVWMPRTWNRTETGRKKWNVFLSCCGLLSHHSTCRTLMNSPWKRFTEWYHLYKWHSTVYLHFITTKREPAADRSPVHCNPFHNACIAFHVIRSGHCHGNSCCAALPPLMQTWMLLCRCSAAGKME